MKVNIRIVNYLVLIVIGFSSVHCSTDESENDPSPILGKWILTNQIYNGEEEDLSDCELEETLTFKLDGTLITYYTDLDPCEFFTELQSYSISNEILIIDFGESSTFEYQILELSDNTLSIKNTRRNNRDLEENNRTTYVYKRI